MNRAMEEKRISFNKGLSVLALIMFIAAVFAVMNMLNCEEVSAASKEEPEVKSSAIHIDSSPHNALVLYENKVDDVDDTAAVVKLINAIKLEKSVGGYAVKISKENNRNVLFLELEQGISKPEEELFDTKMEIFAQQMMALITEIDKVEWVCPVDGKGSPQKAVTGSMDTIDASRTLKENIKTFGNSQEDVHELLMLQNKKY